LESGYPLASEMISRLTRFKDGLDGKAARIRSLVEKTGILASELYRHGHRPQTLDEIVRLIDSGELPSISESERDQLVDAAKTSVAALFLSLEREAVSKGLPGYKSLIKRIFDGASQPYYQQAIKESNHRVLSFNYDRLFEIAFRRSFPDFTEDIDLYSTAALNSGLSLARPQTVEVKTDQFCFLKLHGSVGFESHISTSDPAAEPQIRHFHEVPSLDPSIELSDTRFFIPDEPEYGIRAGKPKPTLITFPHEVKVPLPLSPQRLYSSRVWDTALNVMRSAEEVRIIGYSCPLADSESLKSIFSVAQNCRRYVIENPHPEDVVGRLRTLLPLGFDGSIRADKKSFK